MHLEYTVYNLLPSPMPSNYSMSSLRTENKPKPTTRYIFAHPFPLPKEEKPWHFDVKTSCHVIAIPLSKSISPFTQQNVCLLHSNRKESSKEWKIGQHLIWQCKAISSLNYRHTSKLILITLITKAKTRILAKWPTGM